MAKKTPAHPPFCGDPGATSANCHSLAGATALAAKIRLAWRRIGVTIETSIVNVSHARGEVTYVVRMPNLVNGLPGRRVVLPA